MDAPLSSSASQDCRERLHHLDGARALFMLLGIPFHAALAFAGGGWLVQSGEREFFLSLLVPALSEVRMPGFFLIAGFFAALLIERRGATPWFRARLERLGLPLLAGMALIVAPQTAFLRAHASAQVEGPQDLAGAALSHLWFLPVLLMLCAITALAWPLLRRIEWRDYSVIVLGATLAAYELVLRIVESPLAHLLRPMEGLLDFEKLLIFAPYFLFGIVACRSPAVRARLFRFDPAVAVAGLAGLVIHLVLWQPQTSFEVAADVMGDAFASACLTQSLLALFAKIFARPSAGVRRMVDASFTIYLVHHPVIVVLAVALLGWAMPALAKWALICVAALAISYAVHRLLAKSPILLWLFNGVRPAGRRRLPVPAANRLSDV